MHFISDTITRSGCTFFRKLSGVHFNHAPCHVGSSARKTPAPDVEVSGRVMTKVLHQVLSNVKDWWEICQVSRLVWVHVTVFAAQQMHLCTEQRSAEIGRAHV